jgi:hypothetical protein
MDARMLDSTKSRCEAIRVGTYYCDTPTTDKQCKHHAKAVVGGKYLCLRHAEIAALTYLLERDAP